VEIEARLTPSARAICVELSPRGRRGPRDRAGVIAILGRVGDPREGATDVDVAWPLSVNGTAA